MTNKTPIDLTIRPTHVSSRQTGALVCTMREHGREELVHYAAAAHRDDVAWALVQAWLKNPSATEAELKSGALAEVHGWCVTADQIRAANPAVR